MGYAVLGQAYGKLKLFGQEFTGYRQLINQPEVNPQDNRMALWHLGGAVARPATQDTAFGKRTAPYLLSYDSCWIDPKQGDAVVQWTRDQIEAARPHSPGGS